MQIEKIYDLTSLMKEKKKERTLIESISQYISLLSSFSLKEVKDTFVDDVKMIFDIILSSLNIPSLTLSPLKEDDIDFLFINAIKSFISYAEKKEIDSLFSCILFTITILDKNYSEKLKEAIPLIQNKHSN